MRLKLKKEIKLKIGDTRIKKKFLLFPKILDNRDDPEEVVEEFRWLEWASIKQEYQKVCHLDPMDFSKYYTETWVNLYWL
jgi:hypothetical protein